MARPKSLFLDELALRAKADIKLLDKNEIIQKLQAIRASARFPLGTVAQVLGVAKETIWRWARAYKEHGVEGLYSKKRTPKTSKLTLVQKEKALAWLDAQKNSAGEQVYWTLERLQYAIMKEFDVRLGLTTIWTWVRKEGMTIKVPRPRHAKADTQAQETFKKTPANKAR